MYKAPSFGLGMKKDLRESIETVYNINNTINEEEQLIISLFEEFLKENFHVEMLTEEDLDYILESEFPQWLEENEEYLTEVHPLYGAAFGIAAAARAALPKILGKFSKRKINRRNNIPQSEKSNPASEYMKNPEKMPKVLRDIEASRIAAQKAAKKASGNRGRTQPPPRQEPPPLPSDTSAYAASRNAAQEAAKKAAKKEKLRKQMEDQFRIYRESREDIEATPPLLESEQKNINEFIDINSIHKNVRDWLKGWKKGENNPPPKQQGRLLRTPQSKEKEGLRAAEQFIDGITPQPQPIPPLPARKPQRQKEKEALRRFAPRQLVVATPSGQEGRRPTTPPLPTTPQMIDTLRQIEKEKKLLRKQREGDFPQPGARQDAQRGAGPGAGQDAQRGAGPGARRFASPGIGATRRQDTLKTDYAKYKRKRGIKSYKKNLNLYRDYLKTKRKKDNWKERVFNQDGN